MFRKERNGNDSFSFSRLFDEKNIQTGMDRIDRMKEKARRRFHPPFLSCPSLLIRRHVTSIGKF
jgi:hypothetical protein